MNDASNDSEAVADALWARVRRLIALTQELAEAEALGELEVDGQARLDRARVRLGRAVERAQMADALSDQLADVTAARARSSAQRPSVS